MTADAVGGVWTYALELARGLCAAGSRAALAVMGPAPSAAQAREAAGVAGLDVFAAPFRLEWMDDPWDDVDRAGAWLLSLERSFAPDVVHLNGYCHGELPFRAPRLVAGHSCVLSWWQAVKGGPAPGRYDAYRERVARGLRGARLRVAPTRAMLAALERHYGAAGPAAVVGNGKDPPAAAAAAPAKEPLVFCAARVWDEAKNVAALARAAEGLAWPVYVAGDARPPGGDGSGDARPPGGAGGGGGGGGGGDGGDGDNGGDAAAGPGPRGGARLLGRLGRAEVDAWLARASIYALPARYEPFGLSALEAALAGCALVLGDIPSLREVWGEAAAYVAPDDVEGLRGALGALAADGGRRGELAARAGRRARELSVGRMVARYRAAYARLLNVEA
jgi:glycosyltransferase involved in cell wall biosynthesis